MGRSHFRQAIGAVRKVVRQQGFDVVRFHGDGLDPRSLSRLQANPKTLIDVGAAFGTPGLYDAFPEAYRVLIEPLTEYEPELRRYTTNGKGEYHLVAAGAESGEATITVQQSELTKSSFHERTALTATSGKSEARVVPVSTLDSLYAQGGWPEPILLKIDSEGYEDLVLQGAANLLRNTEFAVVEVSVSERFEGGYRFADLVERMNAADFDFVDALRLSRTRSGKLVHMDCVFKRRQ